MSDRASTPVNHAGRNPPGLGSAEAPAHYLLLVTVDIPAR
jgi:hypothetical protein